MAEQAAHAAMSAGSEDLAAEETGRQSGPEAEQSAGGELAATSLNRSHDRELHRVKLIPRRSPQHLRGRTMRRLPLARLILLGLVILAGLGLFLALSRRTPVVVQPAGTESRP
jgi:hypothetical protein